MNRKLWRFATTCVQEMAGPLYEMIEQARKIKYETFRRAVGGRVTDDWARTRGYFIGSERGLHLGDDYAVRFYKSKFKNKPCYYIEWSRIEHIFLEAA